MADQPEPGARNPLNWRIYVLLAVGWLVCAALFIGLMAMRINSRAAKLYASSIEADIIAREGWLAYRAGQNDRAIGLLQTAVERIPNHAINRMNYGLALLKAGRQQDAKRQFEASLALNPNLSQSLSNLG